MHTCAACINRRFFLPLHAHAACPWARAWLPHHAHENPPALASCLALLSRISPFKMGCDGGTIPKRHELVKTASKPEQPDTKPLPNEVWFYCALSKEPLREPVVSDALGKLYNRENIIHYLLDKSKYGDGDSICGHIRSLKDVLTLKLTPKAEERSSGTRAKLEAAFVCPITRKEMDGHFRFLFLKTCGCVFSEQALKKLPSESCLLCTKPFKPDDIIFINGKPEEVEAYRKNLASFGGSSSFKKKKAQIAESLKRKDTASDHTLHALGQPAKKLVPSAAEEKLERLKTIESIQSIYAKPSHEVLASTRSPLFQGSFYR